MSYRKRGGGLLGLLVVVIVGVMAFAASAQAVAPKFNVAGSTGSAFEVTGVIDAPPAILSVPASNLKLSCPEFEVQEGLVAAGGLTATIKFLFKNCKAFEAGTGTEVPCHVSDVAGSKPELLHVGVRAKLLPIEFADGTYGALAENITSTLNFLSGTGCPLPLKNVITGEVCFRIKSGNDTTEPLIISSKAIQGECPEIKLELNTEKPIGKDKLLFGANEAFVELAAVLAGKGSAAGKTIGVLLL